MRNLSLDNRYTSPPDLSDTLAHSYWGAYLPPGELVAGMHNTLGFLDAARRVARFDLTPSTVATFQFFVRQAEQIQAALVDGHGFEVTLPPWACAETWPISTRPRVRTQTNQIWYTRRMSAT